MPNIEAVASHIIRLNLPALFMDTCIFLDIIRSTQRCLANYAESAVRLLNMALSAEPTCVLVVSSIVPSEWSSNSRRVADEVDAHLKTIEDQSFHFHEACDALGLTLGFSRASYAGSGVAEKLHDLSKRLLDGAIQLDEDDLCVLKAFARVKHGMPPSRSGSEVKDCTIVEESLAVCRRLKELGSTKQRVFCTSNVNDYCDRKKQLHQNLAIEFGDVGLKFTSKLPWAVHELGRDFGSLRDDVELPVGPV